MTASVPQAEDSARKKTKRAPTKRQRGGVGKRDAEADDQSFVVSLRSGKRVPVGSVATDPRGAGIGTPRTSGKERSKAKGKGSAAVKAAAESSIVGVAAVTREEVERLICDWVTSRGGEVELEELVDMLGSTVITSAGGITYAAAAQHWTNQRTVAEAVLSLVDTSTLFESQRDGRGRGRGETTRTHKVKSETAGRRYK